MKTKIEKMTGFVKESRFSLLIYSANLTIDYDKCYLIGTQTARLILHERVDFARQQPDRHRQNRAATVDSCFVLIGTRQHGVAVLYETSNRASSNKMQQNPCPIKFRTLNLPAPRIPRSHITCLREKAGKASNSCLAKSTECRWIKPSEH